MYWSVTERGRKRKTHVPVLQLYDLPVYGTCCTIQSQGRASPRHAYSSRVLNGRRNDCHCLFAPDSVVALPHPRPLKLRRRLEWHSCGVGVAVDIRVERGPKVVKGRLDDDQCAAPIAKHRNLFPSKCDAHLFKPVAVCAEVAAHPCLATSCAAELHERVFGSEEELCVIHRHCSKRRLVLKPAVETRDSKEHALMEER